MAIFELVRSWYASEASPHETLLSPLAGQIYSLNKGVHVRLHPLPPGGRKALFRLV